MVIQALIAALELVYALVSDAPRRHRVEIKAREQIGPEIGHTFSVSVILLK
jgi:hypothetical protein